MLLQIATGMEEPEVVAERFGFSAERYQVLSRWPPYMAQLEAKCAELKASGVTFRIQAQFMAEDLARDVYKIAKTAEATFLQKLEAMRTFTKLGDLEPKAGVVAQTGPAFSITINVKQPELKKVIDVEAEK